MADITNLLLDLEQYNPELVHLNDHCRQFFYVKKIDSKESVFVENTLYVGTVSQAKSLHFYLDFLPLLLTEDTPFYWERETQTNSILVLHKKASPDEVIDKCYKTLEKRNLYLDSMDVLLEALLKDGTLSQIVNTASGLIKNPLIVVDLNFKILACSSNEFRHDRQWLQIIERGYCSFEYIAEFGRALPNTEIARNTPFFIKRNGEAYQECVSRMYSHKKHLGYLVAVESHSTFSRLDQRLCALISDITANIVFVQNELEKTLTEYSRDHIILECLTGEFQTKNSYQERIRNTEFDQPAVYQIVIIDISRYQQFDPRKDVLRESFSLLFPKNWMLWFQGNVVTVIGIAALKDRVEQILADHHSLFHGKNLRFGISDPFHDLFDIAQYHHQGLQALRLAEKLTPETSLAEYNQFKCYDLIVNTQQENQWNTYFSSEFQALLAYDQDNGTDYLETLYHYIMHSRNLQKTAACLFIHKNTVSYRINRIKELFHLDLDQAFLRYQFVHSYHLKQLMDTSMLEIKDRLC